MREPYIRESYDGSSYIDVEVEVLWYVIQCLQRAATAPPNVAQYRIGLVLGTLRPYVIALNKDNASKQGQAESPDAEVCSKPGCCETQVIGSETPQ